MWIVLSRLTGSPVGAAIALLLFWAVFDRFTFGVLPDPTRWVNRWRRRSFLAHQLRMNPHDGRARLELAQLQVERGQGKQAIDTLRPTFDRGADDVVSVFTMGTACLQAGFVDQGEKLLAHAEELDHDFRVGEIFLVRGKARLERKDFAGAQQSLTELLRLRTGSVEGRYLLALAEQGLGNDERAAQLKDAAWHDFTTSPRFQRRKERYWAWRARPSRPVTYLLIIVLVFAAFITVVVPRIDSWTHAVNPDDTYVDPGLDDEE